MKLLLAAILAAYVGVCPQVTFAGPASTTPGTTAPAAKKPRPVPFYGNIGTVDRQANTIKVGKRVFQVTSDTRVTKNGREATLKDAAPGDEVAGSYRKGTGNYHPLISLRIGPKPPGN